MQHESGDESGVTRQLGPSESGTRSQSLGSKTSERQPHPTRGGVVTAKGTGEGLVIRLDGRVDSGSLQEALRDFVLARQAFLSGNEVALEWVGETPEDHEVDALKAILQNEFGIVVRAASTKRRKARLNDQIEVGNDDGEPLAHMERRVAGLFGGIENLDLEDDAVGDFSFESGELEPKRRLGGEDLGAGPARDRLAAVGAALWDEPDARIVYGTMRSGQRVETEHSLVVIGDVNSGAEIVAGGDIVVLGTLRGVAHAGAYDETGGGRFIFSLDLRPTQLRIGAIISRGEADLARDAEIARVAENCIVVEPYHARTALGRLKRW